jgi:exodeoxyribonuclease-3
MRIISFNVNGVRSIATKSKDGAKRQQELSVLETLIQEQNPDVLVLQEIKTQSIDDLAFLKPYFNHIYVNTAVKKGYSGTAVLTNEEPERISYNFDLYEFEENISEKSWNKEGRAITAIFPSCIVVTVYVVNAKPGLLRIAERLEWEEYLRVYLEQLEEYDRPVILCGDLNVAPTDIDIHAKQGPKVPGASIEERGACKALKESFTDSFRYLHPQEKQYSWWSNFANCRERNKGWRIDMILVRSTYKDQIEEAAILPEYKGSDHCPVLLQINV